MKKKKKVNSRLKNEPHWVTQVKETMSNRITIQPRQKANPQLENALPSTLNCQSPLFPPLLQGVGQAAKRRRRRKRRRGRCKPLSNCFYGGAFPHCLTANPNRSLGRTSGDFLPKLRGRDRPTSSLVCELWMRFFERQWQRRKGEKEREKQKKKKIDQRFRLFRLRLA